MMLLRISRMCDDALIARIRHNYQLCPITLSLLVLLHRYLSFLSWTTLQVVMI